MKLYKVVFNNKNEATVETEEFRETDKSYIPIRYSRFLLGHSRIAKDELKRFLIGVTPEEAIELVLQHTKEKVEDAQYGLQRAESKLHAIEMLQTEVLE
jgi:hypothetical protein